MKILHLVTKRQYRGAEVFAANLSVELIKLGHEVVFAGLYKNNDNELAVPRAKNLDLTDKKTGFFSIVLVGKLIRLIKKIKPDLIQCNGSDTLKYMLSASYFIPKTPILYRNISMISKWMEGNEKTFLYKYFFLNRIAHVSSVGNSALEDFIKTFNFPRENISVIRRGIPAITLDRDIARKNLIDEFKFENTDKIVLHIGNFSPEKNHTFLIRLFSELKTSHPDIKLVCIGDGILLETIRTEIKKRGLNSTVFLTGFRKDIQSLLGGADCLVLSSLVEGVPGVVLEAAIQKVPTVATEVGGVTEVLIDNETGYCIKDFNHLKFKEKLISLLENPSKRKEMGENAFQLALREFNPQANALKFEDLYKQLVHQSSK